MIRALGVCLLAAAFSAAQAQQIYRWVDENGQLHVTDTPPPHARNLEKKDYGGSVVEAPTPFELQRAQQNFPVTLYTSPVCKEPCEQARTALNKRGVPFKEVQVWNPETRAELHRITGAYQVPVLLVGRTPQTGFEQGAFDSLLDSAGYPKAGILPTRSQATPKPPEGYLAPGQRARAPHEAEPVPPPEPPAPLGPYAPRFSK
jgi:glutaredoxin